MLLNFQNQATETFLRLYSGTDVENSMSGFYGYFYFLFSRWGKMNEQKSLSGRNLKNCSYKRT